MSDLSKIENALLFELGRHPSPASWALSVQKLSNHYLEQPDAISPWNESWAREALLSYYHPLNLSRAGRAAEKGRELGFFEDLKHVIDLGCGSGAGAMGVLRVHQFESLHLSDSSALITEIAERVVKNSGLAPNTLSTSRESLATFRPESLRPGTILILSYVLTETLTNLEIENLLKRLNGLEALAILEPSTSADARRLQSLRPILSRAGFHIWAPCTHAGECPLLKDSDRDWCHDRLIPETPTWWNDLEAELPMKNRTVTVSYLLARKKPRPELFSQKSWVRVIGDRLEEKTKVRQMICRGENREFISWFPSRLKGLAQDFDLSRGDLFESDATVWKDPRGIERSKEFRLDLEAIEGIQKTRRPHG